MNIPLFDQTRYKEKTSYGEAVRLSNELRFKPAHSFIDLDGFTVNVLDEWGFDCETADFKDFKKWINDKNIKKSQSLLMFIYRIISIRFPSEFKKYQRQIDKRFKNELELIESESKNEAEWLGLVGYQNMVRLDNSLTNPRSNIIKLNNDKFKVVRK